MKNCTKNRSLRELRKGECGVVCSVCSDDKLLCSKLHSMGIVCGTKVEVIGIAPLGDPIEIRARGYILSLRVSEAQGIEVTGA